MEMSALALIILTQHYVVGNRDNGPDYKGIHMGEGGAGDYAIEVCAKNKSHSSYIDFTIPGVDYEGRILYRHSSHSLTNLQDSFTFYTAERNSTTSPDLIINKHGNVGIGTNDPHDLLTLKRDTTSTPSSKNTEGIAV